ncbi:hypothetical protein L210DRAFT_3653000 [Boletus edulis BED1]|uniref:Uncharacterized protein n=1 Tax=Boletus edulis BED1 TaxID=1328754 RepID=A0AAD4G845_BOLED|nr:hypothetical protein L210DRAFT_3653000 [Boletus edulis BED1]
MPAGCRYRGQAIQAFQITSKSYAIHPQDWATREPHAIWYGIPEERQYDHPDGGTYTRCRVETFDNKGNTMGYVPLPRRYGQAWTQLCYTIVYWLATWKAWLNEDGKPHRLPKQPPNLIQECINNSGTRLIKYLHIRRLIIDELLHHRMSKDGCDQLDIFDEYLIRDRFDWLWTDIVEIPKRMLDRLRLDPVHPSNRAIFSWRNPKLQIPDVMVAPDPLPTHTWFMGSINHIDLDAYFSTSFQSLAAYFSTAKYRHLDDMPYNPNQRELPELWHESHEPPVVFETDQQERLQLCQGPSSEERSPTSSEERSHSVNAAGHPPSSASHERPPRSLLSATPHRGIIDNAQTRVIVRSLAQTDGGINLAEAHTRLRQLLDSRYDETSWGRLLDRVHPEPGIDPRFTVDEAFKSVGRRDGSEDTGDEGTQEYRSISRIFY